MEIQSKYMKAFIEKEEDRIRREIALAVCQSLRRAGFRVSVSHDSQNETEKMTKDNKAFLSAVFNSDYDSDRCWVFAAKNGMDHPLWVLLVLENVEDLVSDYHIGAEKFIKQTEELYKKYS